jgi:hypothetical protein
MRPSSSPEEMGVLRGLPRPAADFKKSVLIMIDFFVELSSLIAVLDLKLNSGDL